MGSRHATDMFKQDSANTRQILLYPPLATQITKPTAMIRPKQRLVSSSATWRLKRFIGMSAVCVAAAALIGCDLTSSMPRGTSAVEPEGRAIDDNSLSPSPAKMRVESDQGVFVLSDAVTAKNTDDANPGLLAWWKDTVTEEVSIWGRLVYTQEDVGHALLSLERDFEADLQPLTAQDDGLTQAVLAAALTDEDPTVWRPSSFELALTIMGAESQALDEAVALDARLFSTVSPKFCPAFLKGIQSSVNTSKTVSGSLKLVLLDLLNLCSRGGGGGDGPPCPGDIDCDGIPDSSDPDIDGDGIPNISDPDVDGDGIPNGSDNDVDGDGLDNGNDPDGDGIGNGDDSDIDGDGIGNAGDSDADGDGNPNATDDDDDGDGKPDTQDDTPNGCITDCSGACCNTVAGTCSLKSAATCSGTNQQFQGTNVVCNPNPCCEFGTNPIFPASSATVSFLFLNNPPYAPGLWGETGTKNLNITIDATCDGAQWCAVLKTLDGVYTEWYRLLPGVREVTGPPPGNTVDGNDCTQLIALNDLGNYKSNLLKWYMLQAVIDHEDVHSSRLLPALQIQTAATEALIEFACVPHSPGMSKADAIKMILASDDYKTRVILSFNGWTSRYNTLAANDEKIGGPTELAERAVVAPMISNICLYSKSQCWPPCPAICPARPTGACCDPSGGVCSIKTECDCEAGGGVYRGDNSTCGPPNVCQGACCTPDSFCIDTTTLTCNLIFQGSYQGDGTTCGSGVCSPVIPKVR